MRFIIKKEVEAVDVRDALKQEREAEIVEVYKDVPPPPEMGFQN